MASLRVPTAPQANLGSQTVQVLQAPRATAASYGGIQGRQNAAIGQALEEPARALDAIEARRIEMRRKAQQIELEGQIMMDLDTLGQRYRNDPDPSTAATRFQEESQRLIQERLAGVTDQAVRGQASLAGQKLALTQRAKIMDDAWAAERDMRIATLDNLEDRMSRMAAGAASDAERQAAEATYRSAVEGMAAFRWISDVDAEKRLRSFADRQDVVTARQDILANPDAAYARLVSDPDYLSGMSPENRQRQIEAAASASDRRSREAMAAEDRAYRIGERERRAVEAEASKEGDRLLANNELTPEWVETNRARLNEQDFRYFYRQLTSDADVTTSPQLYADFRARATNGEDIRGELREALVDRRMSQADYDRLYTRVESGLVEDALPNWYKRGERFIQQTLRVSDANPNPADAQMQAAAMDEWTEWARQNPQANETAARDAYRRIATEYRFVDLTETALALPVPSTLTMQAHRQPSSQEVMNAMRTVAERLESGEMTEQEAERQAGILEQWMRVARGSEGGDE